VCLDASVGAAVWHQVDVPAGPLNKLDATTAPTVNEDSGDGYAVGSIWCDVTADKGYICLDATVGAAVWILAGYSDGQAVDAVEAAATTTTTPAGASDYLLAVVGGVLKRILYDDAAKAKQTIILGAGGWPSTTAGCQVLTKSAEGATYKGTFQGFMFDKDAVEYLEYVAVMPDNYDGGTMTARFFWEPNTTVNPTAVVWQIEAACLGDGDALDAAWGTPVTVTDNGADNTKLYISAATAAMTPGGTPAGGKLMHFRISRKATDAADTLVTDAGLESVQVEYGIDKWSA